MTETVIIGVLVGLAALFLAWRVWRVLRIARGKAEPGCGGCSCPAADGKHRPSST